MDLKIIKRKRNYVDIVNFYRKGVNNMLKIYKTDTLSNISKLEKIEKDCWINLTLPTTEEIDLVSKETGISRELILKLLDEEEIPRTEVDGSSTLIVVDSPYIEDTDNKYATMPLGIIIDNNGYLLTISSKKLEVLRNFKNGMVKDLHTEKKSRFTIQILYENAKLYLKYLKFINRNIYNKEKILYNATENKELISVLNIEKSLVYFITSLKENDVLIDRMAKGNVIPMYEDYLDLLEDAQIENKQGVEMANIYREILSSVSDAYATIISNNLNQVMKILTSITIIFSIPTMIASFIGMNVPLGKLSTLSYSFWIIIGISVLISIALAVYLRKKKLL